MEGAVAVIEGGAAPQVVIAPSGGPARDANGRGMIPAALQAGLQEWEEQEQQPVGRLGNEPAVTGRRGGRRVKMVR